MDLLLKLSQRWADLPNPKPSITEYLCNEALSFGKDEQLEECRRWIATRYSSASADLMVSVLRPKPPSLAEQALLAIDTAVADGSISAEIARVTRVALERLQELEQLND